MANSYAIWQAAHKGDHAGLTRLVEQGMDVDARDEVSARHDIHPQKPIPLLPAAPAATHTLAVVN